MHGGHHERRANKKRERANGNESAQLPVWVPVPTRGTAFNDADKICVDIRRLQQRSGFTDVTCRDVLQLFKQYLGSNIPKDFRAVDKRLHKEAGVSILRLNGCPHCNRHVYHPEDTTDLCPHVNTDGTVCAHPRFDEHGKPLEVRQSLFILFALLLFCY